MTDAVERAVLPTSVVHKTPLSVEVGQEVLPEQVTLEARQDESEGKSASSTAMSPQEMGQEALWVEESPRRSMWKISSPSNDSSKKGHAHKAKILLLVGAGAPEQVEVAVESMSPTRVKNLARDKTQTAKILLARALTSVNAEERMQLAVSAFEHVDQARQLLGLEAGNGDQKLARGQGLADIQSTTVSDDRIWKSFNALLPTSPFAACGGFRMPEHIDDQDISTLGFNNTFELPSTKNGTSGTEDFDMMSMSSLNEILDGPLDESPDQRQTGKKKKKLRIVQLFRSRKPESSQKQANHTPNEILTPERHHVDQVITKDLQPSGNRESGRNNKAPDNLHGIGIKTDRHVSMQAPISITFVKVEKANRMNGRKEHEHSQEETAVFKASQDKTPVTANSPKVFSEAEGQTSSRLQFPSKAGLPVKHLAKPSTVISYDGTVEGSLDGGLALEPILSQSPSSTGGATADRYLISVFEADDIRDKYEIQTDKEELSYEIWNPRGECNGEARRKSDRNASVVNVNRGDNRAGDESDEEREKYYVEEERYLVENAVADASEQRDIPASENERAVKVHSLRWFRRRTEDKPELEAPRPKKIVKPKAVPTESSPLKRSSSKRSTKSTKNATATRSSHSSRSSTKESLPAKRRKPLQGSTQAALVSSEGNAREMHVVDPMPEPHYYAPILSSQMQKLSIAHQPDLGAEVRPVRISVVASSDEVDNFNDFSGAVVSDDPLFHSIKIQQTRQHRRGLDPSSANVPGDNRGIDP